MTTNIEVVPVPIVKPRFSWPLALAILALGLQVAVFATTLSITATQFAGQSVAKPADLTSSRGPTLTEYTAAMERNEATLPASLVDNPELMIAHRYIIVENRIASLVDNPELMIAHRYIPVKNEVDPDSDIGLLEFFAVPSETGGQRTIQRSVDGDIGLLEFFTPQTSKSPVEKMANANILASNPELMVASRYVAPGVERAESYFLASNPELQVTQRYATIARQKVDAILLGENPELIIARRFAAAQVE